jgi:uncharacterized membrane protein
MKFLSCVFALLLGLGCATSAAAQGMHICNKSGTTLWVAMARWGSAPFPGVEDSFCKEKGDCTKTQGWWMLDPDQCVTTYADDVSATDAQGEHVKYLYYAHDSSGGVWNGGAADKGFDEVHFCISQAAFAFDSKDSVECSDDVWKLFFFTSAGKEPDHTSYITTRAGG